MRGQLGDGRLRLFGSHAVHVCERLLWLGRHAVQLCVTREQAPPGARDRHAPPAPLTVGRGGSGGRLPCGGAMCGVCAGVYFFFVSVSVPHLRLELVLPHQQPVGLHLPGWLHRCGQHRLQRYDSPSRRMASSRSVRTDTTEHGLTRTPPWLARWWVDARLRLSRSARRHARLISLPAPATACSLNTYKSGVGNATCTPCTPNSVTQQIGSTSSSQCQCVPGFIAVGSVCTGTASRCTVPSAAAPPGGDVDQRMAVNGSRTLRRRFANRLSHAHAAVRRPLCSRNCSSRQPAR